MLNIVLKKTCFLPAPGNPEFYLQDDDFERLMRDEVFRNNLYEFFGRDVCFGRLGKLQESGDYEERLVEGEFLQVGEGNLSYYEKVY